MIIIYKSINIMIFVIKFNIIFIFCFCVLEMTIASHLKEANLRAWR